MRLRGDFAGPEGFLPLPETGDERLNLSVEDRGAHDVVAVRRWLDQPGPATPVDPVRMDQAPWKGFLFWLALREDGLCQLSADAEKATHPLVARLVSIPRAYRWTPGLIGERGLALLLRSESDGASHDDGDEPARLIVQAFGPDPAPAERLTAAVRTWLAEKGSTGGNRKPRLRVYRKGATAISDGATLIPKRQTDIVVSWE